MDTEILTAKDLQTIVSEAHSLRYKGVADDTLIPITDLLDPSTTWNPELEWGSIRLQKALAPPRKWWEGVEDFRTSLCHLNRYSSWGRRPAEMEAALEGTLGALVSSLGPKTGLYLAGGSVCRALCRQNDGNNIDYDLFCVGESEEALVGAIKELREAIIRQSERVYCNRSRNCINMRGEVSRIVIQVVLRKYSTFAEVLHGFDLGSSAVGFDGKMVYLTPLARASYEYGINIVDLACRRYSYEKRLAKYARLGFKIVGECLDISRGASSYHLGSLIAHPCKLWGNVVVAQTIYALVADGQNYASPMGSPELDTTRRRNASAYLRKGEKGYLSPDPAGDPWATEPYWGAVGAESALKEIWDLRIVGPLQDGKLPKGVWLEVAGKQRVEDALFAGAGGGPDMAIVGFEANRERLLSGVETLEAAPIKWVGVESGTNLIGPFDLSAATEEEWYGKHFKAPPGIMTKSAKR